MKHNIHTIFAKAFGFVVIGDGYRHRHYAMSFKEAVSWAACYADGASIYKRNVFVASKKQQ